MLMALCLAAALFGAVPMQSDNPVDALVPENDRIAQLEWRIAELEARLAAAEQKLPPTWTVPATHWTTAPPTSSWPPSAFSPLQRPSTVAPPQSWQNSVVPPQPLPQPAEQEYRTGWPSWSEPQPAEQEFNGVKFRLYLLGHEQPMSGKRSGALESNPGPWLFPEPGDYPPLRYSSRSETNGRQRAQFEKSVETFERSPGWIDTPPWYR
jgi:hypothetical protein